MDTSEERFESLSRNIEENEKKARRRVWISSIVPLFFGLLLLGYTVWQIQVYGQELAGVQVELTKQTIALTKQTGELNAARGTLQTINGQLDQSNQELDELQVTSTAAANDLESNQQKLLNLGNQLTQTSQDLEDANIFIKNNVAVDFFSVKGGSLDAYPAQEEVLLYILNLQEAEVGWNREGFSEEEGFNSPSFAVYVLKQCGLVSDTTRMESKPWQLPELDERIDQPAIGDLVYYADTGFSMFYYELNGESFVIGMTPLGILAQKIDFAPNPAYLGVPYDNYESCFD